MTTINQKYNVYQPSMQSAGQSYLTQNSTAMGGNAVQENPMGSMLFDENFDAKDRRMTWLLTLPILGGLFKTLSLFARSNSGPYEKSFVGRLANWGDKISTGKLAQSKFGQAMSSAGSWIKETTKTIIGKSKILTAITKMPTVPENSMVKSMLTGSKDEIAGEFVSFVEKFTKNGGKLEQLGITAQEFEAIKANPVGSINKMKSICQRVGATHSVKFDNYLGRLTNRTVTLEQIGNKLKAITEPTSKLGKFLPKAAIRGLHGLTFGGGLFMILSAFSLAKAIPTTKKAEKGDKFSTFMEEFLSNISWVITMPLGIKLMNAVGGLKNLGMNPETLKKFREALKIHNGKAFASKAEWQASYDALQALKNTEKVGFFQKIFRGIGKFIGAGREVIKPYINNGANLTKMEKFKNFMAKAKFKGANWIAYPIGFLTYMFIFAPVVDKLFVKASHAVFGKPKHSKYDEKPETPAETPQQLEPGANPFNPEVVTHDSPTNLINMHQQGQQYVQNPGETVKQNGDNYTYIPSSEGVKVAGQPYTEAHRTYIPSAEGVKLQPVDTTLADQAMSRADIAEKNALEALQIKF